MIMCERIERLVVNEFEKLTGVNASENQVMKFEVFPQKREALKQLLRSVLPDLRIYSSAVSYDSYPLLLLPHTGSYAEMRL